MNVLVTADIDKKIEQFFPEIKFDYMGYALEGHIPSTHNELLSVIKKYEILICEFDIIDKEIIDAAKKLKLIICCRGGASSVVDIPYATGHGISVKNTPARNAASVAEYVLGIVFLQDRKILEASSMVLADKLQNQSYVLPEKYRDSLWGMDKSAPYHIFRGQGLHKMTLGVIGYGNIGRIVVNLAVLLGIHVLVYNHHPIIRPVPAGVDVVDKDYLLGNADYISLHCNNREHKIVIGSSEFSKMKKTAYFINTARGDLVDEEALIDALHSHSIRGAALDVTRSEPLPLNSPLIHAPNITITPHIAGATDEVIEAGTDMAIYHLREFLAGIQTEDYYE